MVLMESVVSGHQLSMIRERLGDKIELTRFDPYSMCYFVVFRSISFNTLPQHMGSKSYLC